MKLQETALKPFASGPTRHAKGAEARRVSEALDHMCSSLDPGDRLPKHTEIMRQLNASERIVLRALDDLHRAGRIIRRTGVGTFVAPRDQGASGPAQMIEKAASNTIVVVSRPDNSFFSRCGDLMLRHAQTNGLSVLYQPVASTGSVEFAAPAKSASGPLGYVVLSARLLPVAESLLAAGHRVILIGDPAAIDAATVVPTVHADNVQGAYLAASHLIERGHRRLAYAMVDEHYDRGARWDGLQLAVREAQLSGLEITVTIILMNAVHEWSEKPELAAAYFGRPGSPTGLCAWNDHGAIRLLTVLLRAGVQVPDQVSLVGYDNLPDGTNVSPKLTSVDQCVDQQIRIALRQLTQVDAPQASHTTMVTPVMALRESTRSL